MPPPTEAEPRFWFALAAEDKDHHEAVTRLVDRLLERSIEGFELANAAETRVWREETPLDPYWKVTGAEKRARALRLPLRGHFEGKERLEAVTYRAQLLVWQHGHVQGRRIHIGFIARDTDKKPRKQGAESAVQSGRWPFEVVLAFPDPEVEAWAIAAFEPATKAERARVKELARRLGFSPVEHPEQLTSTVAGAATDAKAVCDELYQEDSNRVAAWLEMDLDVLRDRGNRCGLSEFLRDAEDALVRVRSSGP